MCVWEWRIDNRDLAPGHSDVDSAMLMRHSSECVRDREREMKMQLCWWWQPRMKNTMSGECTVQPITWPSGLVQDIETPLRWSYDLMDVILQDAGNMPKTVMQDAQLAQLSYFRNVYLLSRHLFNRMLQERQNRTRMGTLWDPICMVLSSFPHLSLNCKAPKLQPLLIEWHNNYPSTQLVNRIVSIPPDACSQLAILIFES